MNNGCIIGESVVCMYYHKYISEKFYNELEKLYWHPEYNLNKEIKEIMFNDITNVFFYRSSPWDQNTQRFIGKDSPQTNPNAAGSNFPGFGYNKQQIQFTTTITDLGPRDYFINEIC